MDMSPYVRKTAANAIPKLYRFVNTFVSKAMFDLMFCFYVAARLIIKPDFNLWKQDF